MCAERLPVSSMAIAITGASKDRVALRMHDVGLQLVTNYAGEIGFRVKPTS